MAGGGALERRPASNEPLVAIVSRSPDTPTKTPYAPTDNLGSIDVLTRDQSSGTYELLEPD